VSMRLSMRMGRGLRSLYGPPCESSSFRGQSLSQLTIPIPLPALSRNLVQQPLHSPPLQVTTLLLSSSPGHCGPSMITRTHLGTSKLPSLSDRETRSDHKVFTAPFTDLLLQLPSCPFCGSSWRWIEFTASFLAEGALWHSGSVHPSWVIDQQFTTMLDFVEADEISYLTSSPGGVVMCQCTYSMSTPMVFVFNPAPSFWVDYVLHVLSAKEVRREGVSRCTCRETRMRTMSLSES
jgi:hypothetical protein